MKLIWRSALASVVLVPLSVGRAHAVDLDFIQPQPTLNGDSSVFEAELLDATGVAEIRWDFGDGTVTEFSAADTTVEHTYAAPGHYSVVALAQDEGGFASSAFIHTVYTQPTNNSPRSSSKLILDPERELIVTANTDNGTVTLVDLSTLTKLDEIEVFSNPVALALAPDGKLWVVDSENYAIAIVDLDTRKTVEFFRLPYASQPAGIVFSPGGDAYITLTALGDVLKIDASSHEILTQRHVASFMRGITISGDGSDLWVTRFISQGDRGEVYRLESDSLDTIARYDLSEDTTTEDTDHSGRGLPNYLFSVAVTPDGTRAWIPSKKDNMARGLMRDGLPLTQDNAVRPLVSVLDLENDEELFDERIDLDDRNLPNQVTFSPLGDWAFVTVFGSNLVELRDAFDRSFVTALRADNLLGPEATLLAPDNQLIVLADLSRKVVVFDVGDLLSGVDQSTRVVAEVALVQNEKLSSQVLRGKQVFNNAEDKRMASEGYLSCSSCHFDGFEDGLVWDFFDRGEGFRNTTSLLGRRGTGHGRVHWSGNFDEVQDFENPIRVHQGGLGFLAPEDFETGTVSDPLGDAKAGLDPDLDALAAYVGSFDSIPRSPMRNADGTMTDSALRGEGIFLNLACDSCHAGEDFTNSAENVLYDVGTLTEFSGSRLGGELSGIDTPTLLGIWQTAPYLHDGSAATLLDVLTTSNVDGEHGDTLSLSDAELDDLVAYLEQLDQGLPVQDLTLPTESSMGGMGGMDGNPPEPASGGTENSGGATSSGGTHSSGGTDSSTGGNEPVVSTPASTDDGGCGCRVAGSSPAPNNRAYWWVLGVGCFSLYRRRLSRHSLIKS